MNLYTNFATEFSNTRKSAWAGWLELLPAFKSIQPLNMLDVGCGNARFLNFIIDQKIKYNRYLGVDNSEELLHIAATKALPNASFKLVDVEKQSLAIFSEHHVSESSNQKTDVQYNVISMFGLMHHITSTEKRKELVDETFNMLSVGGLLVITFWQFKSDKAFFDSHVVSSDDSSLGKNDYILRFGQKATRFCHYVDESELSFILKDIPAKSVVRIFQADGKNASMNKYVVLKRS